VVPAARATATLNLSRTAVVNALSVYGIEMVRETKNVDSVLAGLLGAGVPVVGVVGVALGVVGVALLVTQAPADVVLQPSLVLPDSQAAHVVHDSEPDVVL
jgi:tetrahydromethanopterin S-methyltransferase subunit C